jgi:hypothetical protein
LFTNKARVSQTKEGCRWYDQDIVFLDYDYTGDCVIDMTLQYNTPGFGIFLVEDDGFDIFDSEYSVLYRLSDRYLQAHQYNNAVKKEIDIGSFPVEPNGNTINLIFYKTDNRIWMVYTYVDSEGNTQVYGSKNMTDYTLSNPFDTYRIGFYSNAGNVLQYASIASGMPTGWIVNIHNTNGGRVSFHENGFKIEECEFNADVAQQNIELKAGTYYLNYDESENSDINVYVNLVSDTERNTGLYDETKTILQPDNSFILKEDSKINIKFSGTHGTIDNIRIDTIKDHTYIPSDIKGIAVKEGSIIRIDTNTIQQFTIEATIQSIPEYELTEEAPYFVLNTDKKYIMEDMNLDLNKKYQYLYENNIITVQSFTNHIEQQYIELFSNMNVVITKFIIVDNNNRTIDILHMETYKTYISDKIQSPILITDTSYQPFDISSSYREIIIPHITFDLFSQSTLMSLTKRPDMFSFDIKVYGIPESATIDRTQKSIDLYASSYTILNPQQYEYDYQHNIIAMDTAVRNTYKYIVVSYNDMESYTYYFTNWEREVFDARSKIMRLEKTINPSIHTVYVYGIPKSQSVWLDYLYRVSSEKMIHSIDAFSSVYETIKSSAYTINYDKNRIYISPEITSKYRYIIIDYLKEDSYAINNVVDMGQYEVDISTKDTQSLAVYDMGEQGKITNSIATNIVPKKNTYIILRKEDDIS